jgi:hypothetical protein
MRLKGFTAGWTNASICVEGAAVSINGLSPWSLSWQRTSEELIIVPHPNYATERHKAWVHEIEDNAKRIRFASRDDRMPFHGAYCARLVADAKRYNADGEALPILPH